MSPQYLAPKRFEELGLTIAKYQTATDASIQEKATLLKSANLHRNIEKCFENNPVIQ